MIVATAGHVDHGKTWLVEAITGNDTDTLPEEKKRGLTIDIGFAYLPIEGRLGIGFIDVPGHGRFIKNALCGLSAANFILLVVAADDGPMPQTREHLSIINLLDIRQGAIVISKIDRVPVEQIDRVKTQVKTLTRHTALQEWPVLFVSAHTSQGIGKLHELLVRQSVISDNIKTDVVDQNNFRMAIDRKFQKQGVGLIITGTIFSGSVNINNRVGISGTTMQLRVRDLRVQNSPVNSGRAGQRCAINLAGIDLQKDNIMRGAWVVSEGVAAPVSRFDAEIEMLGDSPSPLKHWMPVHLHLAASETTARIAVLEGEPIKPGKSGLVQVVCDHPTGAVFGDHFVIRDTSARFTLGGGRIIDIFPPRRGRAAADRISLLRKANNSDTHLALKALLDSSRSGVDLDQFGKNRNLTEQASSELFDLQEMVVLEVGNRRTGFSGKIAQVLSDGILQSLKYCHQNTQDARGFTEAEILRQMKNDLPTSLFKGFLRRLLQQAHIRNDVGGFALTSDMVDKAEDDAHWPIIKEVLINAGTRAMSLPEIAKQTRVPAKQLKPFLLRAGRDGLIAKLSKTLWLLPVCLHRLHDLTEQLVNNSSDGLFSVAEFRDATGIGRNRCVEILEGFDAYGITKRIDQGRQLLPTAKTAIERLLNNG